MFRHHFFHLQVQPHKGLIHEIFL